ncbi:hypothetical protein BH24CHL6_BH24CHL6_05600 [soil metagenome]
MPILVALALLSAFILAARAFMAWEAIGRASDAVLRRGVEIETSRDAIQDSFTAFRGKLNEASVGLEGGLWALARFDEKSRVLEGTLRDRRAEVEEFRVRYVGPTGRGLRRARRALRLLKQLIELRRTVLG